VIVGGGIADPWLPRLGWACLVSGVLGVLIGAITLGYPEAVPEEQWSYPFTTTAQWVISVPLALAHLLTAAGFVGVLRARAHAVSRVAAVSLVIAATAFAGLGACELASGAIGSESTSSSAATAVSTAFGIASMLTALGSIVAGIVIVRAAAWSGWDRWWLLISGVLMLFVVTPAILSEDLWLRTLALMLWSAVFIPLGKAISRGSAVPARTESGDLIGV
jgi:hypothetical protein